VGGVPSSDPISYTLDIDTYDNLRDPHVVNPRILVVVFVPQDLQSWALQDESRLAMHHCGFWTSLAGEPPAPGQTFKTVHRSRANIFTPHAVQAMMVSASNGQGLATGLAIGAQVQ